ncbi:MAG TPA: MFS transporter, partial [Leptolyngbyaceae cyanobacterium]
MFKLFKLRLDRWLPALDHRIWILAGGRLLSQIGIGFTLFYAPIFFVDQVGLTATQVGLGIGS